MLITQSKIGKLQCFNGLLVKGCLSVADVVALFEVVPATEYKLGLTLRVANRRGKSAHGD